MLGLVELVRDDRQRAPQAGHGLAETHDEVGRIEAHELGSGDGDRRGDLDGTEQRRERPGGRRVVVTEQPEPFVVAGRGNGGEGVRECPAEGASTRRAHEFAGVCLQHQLGRQIGRTDVDGDDAIGSPSLRRQCG